MDKAGPCVADLVPEPGSRLRQRRPGWIMGARVEQFAEEPFEPAFALINCEEG
jgi:hypothetical protein